MFRTYRPNHHNASFNQSSNVRYNIFAGLATHDELCLVMMCVQKFDSCQNFRNCWILFGAIRMASIFGSCCVMLGWHGHSNQQHDVHVRAVRNPQHNFISFAIHER